MVIDLKRCIGCYGCQVACKSENGTRPGTTYARLLRMESGTFPNVRRTTLPLLCMHCADPPCVDVCPTGASEKREDGIVFIDTEICVGCRACMMACPYGARYYQDEKHVYFDDALTPYEQARYADHIDGVVEKCDFCRHRLEQGQEPACVANCMTKARIFGDLDDPKSEVSRLVREEVGFQLNPELGTDPSVFYLAAVR
jgi:molybdopterin-containing oxidoreductase family iron-sulfur binding subunit|tara:strand:+ start:53 stop:649 length:597 start_codon:yes stop_codon:yes gene_type:complete